MHEAKYGYALIMNGAPVSAKNPTMEVITGIRVVAKVEAEDRARCQSDCGRVAA